MRYILRNVLFFFILSLSVSKLWAPGSLGLYTFSHRVSTFREKNALSFKKSREPGKLIMQKQL